MSLSCRAVYTIFAIEWLQTILITDDAFDKYALHYGDVDNLVCHSYDLTIVGGNDDGDT